ncbi:MAG TPA: hypothetical protein VGE88_01555 [Lysobacter sp.]
MICVYNPQPLTQRERQLTDALREFDPDAEVRIEDDGGKLSVSTVLDEMEVIAILGGIGIDAALSSGADGLDHDDQPRGDGCGCGCGCG